MYIGNSFSKYERLVKDMEDSVSMCEGDVKRFDSSLFIIDTIISTSLGRLYYDLEDEEIDDNFIAIFDNSSTKDYYTPTGHIYRIINGLSSGVKSTSLFGSFINLVNLCHVTGNYDSKKIKFSISGDDFLFGSTILLDRNSLDQFKSRCSEIGHTFKKLAFKDFNALNSKDLTVFYKYSIHNKEPIVIAMNMLERVFLPSSKKYKTNAQILELHQGVYNNVISGSLSRQRYHATSYSKSNFSFFYNRKRLGFNLFLLFKDKYRPVDCLSVDHKV